MPAKVPTLSKFTFKSPPGPCYIATLHVDELYYIFQMSVFTPGASFNVPIILSRVCSRWRSIVRQAPLLWTSVGNHEYIENPGRTAKHLRRLEHYLRHSGQSPLDVSIVLKTSHPPYSLYDEQHPFTQYAYLFKVLMKTLSVILAPHLGRVRRFSLSADELSSVLDVQSGFRHCPMPLLESWETMVESEEMGVLDTLEGRELGETLEVLSVPLRPRDVSTSPAIFYPRLTTLTLCGTPLAFGRFAPTNLRELSLGSLPEAHRPDLPTLREMLLANQHSLEKLSLCLAEPTGESAPPFILPHLVSLKLGFFEPKDVLPLVTAMRVPQLTCLCLLDQQRGMTFPVDLTGVYEDTSLLLSHIQFAPDLYDEARHIEDVPNIKGLDIRTLPFQFFMAMERLETLSLAYPAATPLNCLNYLPIAGNNTVPKRPLPGLRHLNILLFSLPLVQSFIKTREESKETFDRLESISFTMPCEWQGDGIGAGLGGWLLCRRRHVNYSAVDPDTEQALRSGVQFPEEEV
ncbi:hypothetical protein LshimejAT787_0201460 [Lyophyllum shimeji]|uniref:F-box domain-containing protein n=1 Tax=Lyophyllum shimeji TaxID=47721 RepID=A0A9P3PEW0_LYOSH|nr:hypothetical protein LshimejAT787_0201460 [Lyophyllum shimeji]